MATAKTAKPEGLVYKGHPLRRVDNLIYYGTMAEKYIIMMQVLDSKKEKQPSGWTVPWPEGKNKSPPTKDAFFEN